MFRLMLSPTVWCVVLLGCCFSCVSAQDDTCYTSGSVAGIVIATVVVTLVTAGLAAAFIWYLWKKRRGDYGDDKSLEKPVACPPMSPDKQLIVRENDYAFDNPYFKDDETDHVKHDAAEKGESGFHMDNGDITPSQNAKQASNGTGHQKKNRPFSSLPFHAVFHPSGKKQRATTDDTYISKHLERISVPLRGHDFTGLGFNICGNMRDGIFVKDVLHRGPASESGKIKAGDRIVGVTVSFAGMVYEDALTILSYASPYDVKLELEKCASAANNATNVANLPSSSPKRLGASTSFRSCGQRGLFHPLYRSQSIDDLTQIGKEGFQKEDNSPAVNSKTPKDPSATPKRSQSVEASNGGPKSRPAFAVKSGEESKPLPASSKGSRKSSTSSCDSTNKAAAPLPEKTQPVPVKEECAKKEVKSSRFRVEQINVKSEAPLLPVRQAPPVKPARDSSSEEKLVQESGILEEKLPDPLKLATEQNDQTIALVSEAPQGAVTAEDVEAGEKQPMAPPRKSTGTPAKRRAPAPPPASGPSSSTTTETAADVHRADEQPTEVASTSEITQDPTPSSEPPPPPTSEVPDPKEHPGTPDIPSVGGDRSDHSKEPDDSSSPGKRKASSLGDLTTLERGSRKTSASSAILERAVSMDLQQSMPGENLSKQKKILRTPAFEDDYDENTEGDLNDTEGGLKRWDDDMDKVLAGLTNGHAQLEDDIVRDGDIIISSMKEQNLGTEAQHQEMNEPPADATTPPPKKVLTLDLDLNLDSSSGSETTLQDIQDPEKPLTSTPNRKLIQVKDFLKDDDVSLDDVPYMASAKQDDDNETTVTKQSVRTTSSSTPGPLFAPVTISIPIIKPDMTNYEKLPSPPPASTHPALDASWKVSKISSTSEDSGRYPLERISVQSLYRPIFSSKDAGETDDGFPTAEAVASTEKLVNGNDSDVSEHYSTAQESSMETSTLSVTLSSPTVGNNVSVKTPNNAAGFAKTLIIPGPNEVENLLSLAAEPNTPPPQLEPPPKPIETE